MNKYIPFLLFILFLSKENLLLAQNLLAPLELLAPSDRLENTHTWIGMRPMEYNPSFAGSTGASRIVGSGAFWKGRVSQPNDKNYIITGDLSYDNFIPKIRSGIGLTVSTYHQNEKSTRSYFSKNGLYASFVLSPKISLKGKYTIAPSFEFTYGYSTISTDLDNKWVGFANLPAEFHSYHTRTGIMFNSEKMYAGYTASFHLGTSADGILHYHKKQYHSFQAGYKFQKSVDSKFSFTPQAALILGWTKLDYPYNPGEEIPELTRLRINLNFRYKKIVWGIGNSLAMLGYQTDKLKIMYTQNWVGYKSPHKQQSNYTGELSVRLLIPKKNKALIDF